MSIRQIAAAFGFTLTLTSLTAYAHGCGNR